MNNIIAAQVMRIAEDRERLARTWDAAAKRYDNLAAHEVFGSPAQYDALAESKKCRAFAHELRQPVDTYRSVGDFYRQAAIDHLNKAVDNRYNETLALHHLGIAEKFMDRAEAL